MNEVLMHEIIKLISKEMAPLQAKIDILQSEVERLHKNLVELERKAEELDGWADVQFEEDNDLVPEPIDDVESPLLNHLLSEVKPHVPDIVQTPHVSLTIDLSKKEL